MDVVWSTIAGVGALLAIAAVLGAAAAVFRTSGLRADVDRLRGRVDDLTKERDDERRKRVELQSKVEHQAQEIETLRSLVPSGEQLALMSTLLSHLSQTLADHHEEAITGHERIERLAHDLYGRVERSLLDLLRLHGGRRNGDQIGGDYDAGGG